MDIASVSPTPKSNDFFPTTRISKFLPKTLLQDDKYKQLVNDVLVGNDTQFEASSVWIVLDDKTKSMISIGLNVFTKAPQGHHKKLQVCYKFKWSTRRHGNDNYTINGILSDEKAMEALLLYVKKATID